MKRNPLVLPAALLAAIIVTAALIDAASILTRPLQPYFAWMLP